MSLSSKFSHYRFPSNSSNFSLNSNVSDVYLSEPSHSIPSIKNYIVPQEISNVLVIYCGGTIGMKWTEDEGYIPTQGWLYNRLQSMAQFHDKEFSNVYLTSVANQSRYSITSRKNHKKYHSLPNESLFKKVSSENVLYNDSFMFT